MKKVRELEKYLLLLIDYTKAFDGVDHNKLWKILKRLEDQTTLPISWETCMQVKRQQLELDVKQWTGSKLGKQYVKSVYCHLAYLTSMQSESESCSVVPESLHHVKWWAGWITSWNQDCEQKYQQFQMCRWYHSNGWNEEELWSLLLKVNEES